MFARPRAKKSILPPPAKRRKKTSGTEEISFDFDARADYLTGFHKRKVQRVKKAQEEAALKAREERLAARKQLRDERRQELEAHIEAVHALLDDAKLRGADGSDDLEDNVWDGFPDGNPSEAIDHQAEYIDEDRYTTVTVEAVDVSKEGLQKVAENGHTEEDYEKKSKMLLSNAEIKTGSGRKMWPRKTKKKFRYESKAERKITRGKQKAGNKNKADVRRGAN